LFDVLIKGGRIIDGTGNPWFKADIGIKEDKISEIGHLKSDADKIIEAAGLVVSPGFIDIHSHSDYNVLVDPMVQSKVRQGVTTEVVGMCGSSAAPMNHAVRAYREKYSSSLDRGYEYDWETMDDYLNKVNSVGASFNLVTVIGHGTIRQNVMQYEDRHTTPSELDEMKQLVDESMKAGAYGISTGLIYTPGVYADISEIIELSKIVASHGGIYFSHIRGEGATLLEAVREAISIGEQAGLPIQIAHFKASGKPYWGQTVESLRLVEEARRGGVDVTFDQYPYNAGSTGLSALLPHWALEGGGDKILERLNDQKTREKIKESKWNITRDLSTVMVSSADKHPDYVGKSVSEIAKIEDKDDMDTTFDLLIAENMRVGVVLFTQSEEDVRRVMKSPYGMVGSDGSAVSPEGVLGRGKPHPRFYGTFPRVIGHYVRDGVLDLQEAVRKMTSASAQRLGLRDRGLIREGFKADITVFDEENVNDEATFVNPHRYAAGILYVFVNGTLVIEKGEHTGALPGRALRKD